MAGAIFMLASWLFTGIYRDDEFDDANLFLKYRPSFKICFYSPGGMEDYDINKFTTEKQNEQMAFDDFVSRHHLQNKYRSFMGFLPFILIQTTLSFLCIGLYKFTKKIAFKKWQLPVHFLACMAFTFFGIIFILAFDKLYPSIILSLVVLGLNYMVLAVLTRKNFIPQSSN